MQRMMTAVGVVLAVVVFVIHDEKEPESVRETAHRLVQSELLKDNRFTARLEELTEVTKDSVHCIFLVTSDDGDSYIPQQRLFVTLTRDGDQWVLSHTLQLRE